MARERSEHGAIAVLVAVLMTVVLGIAAFTVDLGVQRVARRDMQALADSVAVDLARLLNGRTRTQVEAGSTGFSSLTAARTASIARNDDLSVGDPSQLLVTPYLVKLIDDSSDVDTVKDNYASSGGVPVQVAAGVVPDAVVVVASTSVSFGFANVLGFSSGGVTRDSLATARSSACFSLGSYAAALDSSGSTLLGPLNGLLALNTDLVSYQGLAGASLSLADLALDSHIGSVDELLNGNVTLGELSAAAISVLNNQPTSPANLAAIAALQAIRLTANLAATVDVGGVVRLDPSDSAALNSQVNLLDLVASSILVADGQHALSLPNLNIAGITGSLYAVQGIQRVCSLPNDPTAVARASQVRADLTVPLSFPTGSSVLGLSVTGNATVAGGLGNAEGRLVSPPEVVCKSGTVANPDTYQVDVNGGLLGLGVKANVTIDGTVTTSLLGGLLDSLLGSIVQVKFNNVTLSVGTDAPGVSTSVQHAGLRVPQNAYNTTPRGTAKKTGSAYGQLGSVPNITNTTVISGSITVKTGGLLLVPGQTNTVSLNHGPISGLVSTLLGTLNSSINTTVNSALVPALNTLFGPLSSLLGINVGGSDVYGEFRPTCNGASLIG